MASLDADFEAAAEQALLEQVAAEWASDDGPIQAAVERSHRVLEEYGRSNDYDVGPVIEALSEPAISIEDGTVRAYWGWFHPAAPRFEFGTSDHTVDGDPVLSFVWEDPPQKVREKFDREGSGYRVFLPETEVSGLPESRFVRDGVHHARRLIGD